MDHYRRLGVSRSATYDEIHRSYRRLARRHHPDANGDRNPNDMAELNEAWYVLSDARRRTAYDAQLRATAPRVAPRVAPPPPPPVEEDEQLDDVPFPALEATAAHRWMLLITVTMVVAAILLSALFVYAFIRSGSTTR